MNDTHIIFCGLSKNNISTLKKNINFFLGFNKFIKNKKIKVLIVDSDSTDGTKEYLNELSAKIGLLEVIHKDNIYNIPSRVERIKMCRNICLDFINRNIASQKIIYIPCDLDIFLFSNTSYQQLENLITYTMKKKNNTAIFPVSNPHYYDIFALRAPGWLNINSQLIVSKLKKFFKIGSFFWNYLFIFRYQLTPAKIQKKNFTIISAFGGIGIYDISDLDLNKVRYEINKKSRDWYSEHIYFNSYFKNLEIKADWIIDAPSEHVVFKSLSLGGKIIYFLKSIKHDLKSIIK